MKLNKVLAMLAVTGMCSVGNAAFAEMMEPTCGASTGKAATGEAIKVGGIHGNAAPGDFSSSTDAAKAYFDCVNANGGIHGRPVDYMVENDQWNPELASQAASKLVVDKAVVAMVGNGSFIEMSVNAPFYKEQNIMAMAAACAVSECFESSNLVSTNQGPLASSVGAAQYAEEELGSKNIACIGLAIPTVGPWSCNEVTRFMEARGKTGSTVLLNPGAPDVNSGLLEAIASGADTIMVNLPAGLGVAMLAVAQEQDLGDAYKWIASTPLYDASVPGALGEYWDGKLFINAELVPFSRDGADNTNWLALMDKYAAKDDPRDTFSQAGYLSARYFTETLMAMDAKDIDDRAKVTTAIKAISGYTSDMTCGPFYVGEADRHMPNHAGVMVVVKDGGFKEVRDCYEYDSPYFAELIETEKKLGLR